MSGCLGKQLAPIVLFKSVVMQRQSDRSYPQTNNSRNNNTAVKRCFMLFGSLFENRTVGSGVFSCRFWAIDTTNVMTLAPYIEVSKFWRCSTPFLTSNLQITSE